MVQGSGGHGIRGVQKPSLLGGGGISERLSKIPSHPVFLRLSSVIEEMTIAVVPGDGR
jgi:hypothetical protein